MEPDTDTSDMSPLNASTTKEGLAMVFSTIGIKYGHFAEYLDEVDQYYLESEPIVNCVFDYFQKLYVNHPLKALSSEPRPDGKSEKDPYERWSNWSHFLNFFHLHAYLGTLGFTMDARNRFLAYFHAEHLMEELFYNSVNDWIRHCINGPAAQEWILYHLKSGEEETADQWTNEISRNVSFRARYFTELNINEETLKSEFLIDESEPFLYHPTSHTDAVDIIRYGPDIATGISKQDFSTGHGFYLCYDWNVAVSTAERRYPDPAILVYHLSKEKLFQLPKGHRDAHQAWHLSLQNRTQEWQNVIRHFRSGSKSRCSVDGRSVREYKMISGPMCENNGQVRKTSKKEHLKAVIPVWSDPPKMQVCITDPEPLLLINPAMIAAIFWKRP